MVQPKVFISYSWEDDKHKQWVRQFADRLLSDGVNVTIDQPLPLSKARRISLCIYRNFTLTSAQSI